jgi:hypothetical protein
MTWTKSKKTKKLPAAFGKLKSLLRSLKLDYREFEKNSANYYLVVKRFGIVFRFSSVIPSESKYPGWDIIDVSTKQFEHNSRPFIEELMWLLVSKGYMHYIRNESGQTFSRLIQQGGWGRKIIEKRLEFWNNEPRHRYLIEHNKRMLSFSVSYILSYYPDFFDVLV